MSTFPFLLETSNSVLRRRPAQTMVRASVSFGSVAEEGPLARDR
jgi:hypothetical protein